MKEWVIKILKTIASDVRQAAVPAILLLLIGGTGGLLLLSEKALDFARQSANIPTPLWATISLIFLCVLYTYLAARRKNPQKSPNIEEELHEAFGVYWNSQYKLRCLRCKWPLKCASKGHDPSIFWCSNCDKKFALRDPNGNPLTEAMAIAGLKELLTTASTRPDNALAV